MKITEWTGTAFAEKTKQKQNTQDGNRGGRGSTVILSLFSPVQIFNKTISSKHTIFDLVKYIELITLCSDFD